MGPGADLLHQVITARSHLQLDLRISAPTQGHAVANLQHAFLNGLPLATSDPVCKHLNSLHQAASCHVFRKQQLQADADLLHPIFLAQITCPPDQIELAHEVMGYTVSFNDWGPVAAALQAACWEAWRPVLPEALLREPQAAFSRHDNMRQSSKRRRSLAAGSEHSHAGRLPMLPTSWSLCS